MATISETIAALASCLCAELNDTGLCFCGVFPGADPYDAMGGCEDTGCGQAWVRLLSLYPSSTIGQLDTSLRNCSSGLSYDVEIGVLRCFPQQEEAMTEAEMLAIADQQYEDMLAMRRAVVCCEELDEYILGAYVPVGPDIGAIGGLWTLSVGAY
jgi:hypothetical protein